MTGPDTDQENAGVARSSPSCPICSRAMEFCEPSHEKAYWVCLVDHEPPGIIQKPEEIGYAFALALVRVNDKFDEHGVEPFADVEEPRDASGLVVDLALARLESCLEFKRMRWRKGHDSVEGHQGPQIEENQAGLGRWSA